MPVGIIMGKNVSTHKTPLIFKFKMLKFIISLYLSKEGKKASKIFIDVNRIDEELLKETKKEYKGEVAFFAMDVNYRD